LNCTCCSLTQEKITATGFGRNQQEALINATKNYLETLIATNTNIPQLKNALKLREGQTISISAPRKLSDDTLDLEPVRELCDLSVIADE
jgi:hypothetical protein